MADAMVQLVSVDDGRVLNLTILPEVSTSKSARYSDFEVFGRSSSIPQYTGSNSKEVNMRFDLDSFRIPAGFSNIDEVIKWLESFTYPTDNSGLRVGKPRTLYIVIGNNLLDDKRWNLRQIGVRPVMFNADRSIRRCEIDAAFVEETNPHIVNTEVMAR